MTLIHINLYIYLDTRLLCMCH